MLLRYQPYELFTLADERAQPDHTLLPVDGRSVSTLLEQRNVHSASGILIDLGLIALSLFRALPIYAGCSKHDVLQDFLEWADAYGIDT